MTDNAFGEHDYEIDFGGIRGRFNRSQDVNIRAVRARPPAVGDIYTFGRENRMWDAIVAEITREGGAWNARCRVVEAPQP